MWIDGDLGEWFFVCSFAVAKRKNRNKVVIRTGVLIRVYSFPLTPVDSDLRQKKKRK